MASNSSLKGDILLIFAATSAPAGWIEETRVRFPGLEIRWECSIADDGSLRKAEDLPTEVWDGVTMLSTYAPPPARLIPNVRFVQLTSAGSDMWRKHEKYLDKNVVFCVASGAQPPQIAEWVIGTWLASSHHLLRYANFMNKSHWDLHYLHDVEDSAGLRMGILGYGAIGRQVARIARAIGMEVYAFTQSERPTAESRRDDTYSIPGMGDSEGCIPSKWFHGTSRAAVNDFLKQDLDVLVISLPLTDSTHHLIDREQFEILGKKKAFLSNIARGPVVNTEALIEALEKGELRGAALDVTDPEPLPREHPLWKAPNVLITPHVSWLSTKYWGRVMEILSLNLEAIATEGKLVNPVRR
ncbi:2-hydroxyacid dehydrogenase [Pleurostoma richardsiae]|uniref:2-hydroxyacid dehydrogenase n=1 Tax=Pleurostoma richardsiae TaxID=41990 RepID=A0AA38VKJ5_9PEZI|nr:2-hydroxyacid dehydrogenase [Pleurostoma richardsiae]